MSSYKDFTDNIDDEAGILAGFEAEFGKKEDFPQPGAMWEAFFEIYRKGYDTGWDIGYEDGLVGRGQE